MQRAFPMFRSSEVTYAKDSVCSMPATVLAPDKVLSTSSSFDEHDECSRLLAVETLLTMHNVIRASEQEMDTFLDECLQDDIQSWRQQLAACDTFHNSVFSLGVAQPNSLQSYLSCSSAGEDVQEIRALNVLRSEFACAKCFIMMKRKCHPDLRQISPCRVQGTSGLAVPKMCTSTKEKELGVVEIHEYYLAQACERLLTELTERKGQYSYVKDAYDDYVQSFLKSDDPVPRSRRSFDRYLLSNYKVVVIRSVLKGRGLAVMTPASASFILTSALSRWGRMFVKMLVL